MQSLRPLRTPGIEIRTLAALGAYQIRWRLARQALRPAGVAAKARCPCVPCTSAPGALVTDHEGLVLWPLYSIVPPLPYEKYYKYL
jgi:hypothetical protein